MKNKTPAIYNSKGKRFAHCVKVPRDPNTKPTYSFKFPVLIGTAVEERWGTKVRPIKSLTAYLKGCSLKKYEDYMVGYNVASKHYEYWFAQGKYATLFAIRCAMMQQSVRGKGYPFNIECPQCQHQFRHIKWTT
mgnify:FL=1